MGRLPASVPSVPVIPFGALSDLSGPYVPRPRTGLTEGVIQGMTVGTMTVADELKATDAWHRAGLTRGELAQ